MICDENDINEYKAKHQKPLERQHSSLTDKASGASASMKFSKARVIPEISQSSSNKLGKNEPIVSSESTTDTSKFTSKIKAASTKISSLTVTRKSDTETKPESIGQRSYTSGAVSHNETLEKRAKINSKPTKTSDDKKEQDTTKKEPVSLKSTKYNKEAISPQSMMTKSDISKVIWSYQKDNAEWASYPAEISKKIETAFSRKPNGTTVIQLNSIIFQIHFPKMIQVDTNSKETRSIRRTGP